MSEWLAERVGGWLSARSTRRDVLVRTTVAGAALATYRMRYVLKPGTAMELIASNPAPGRECPPGSLCKSDGYVEFCCTVNSGINACPPGTIAGGWWKADGSKYCDGPRYYIDCSGVCNQCRTGCETGFCPDCDSGPGCDCANGSCFNRRTGCRTFRYGRCNQHVACVGRLMCRVVSCTPAWMLDPTCTTSATTDNRTADHHSDCLDSLVVPTVGIARTPTGQGYWLVQDNGYVAPYGDARFFGSMGDHSLNEPIVGMAPTPSGQGYWLAAADGGIFNFGDAKLLGSTGSIKLNRAIVGIAATLSGNGYWLVASDGGIFAFGDAPFLGSTGGIELNQSIVGMARTPSGNGYWLVASDGGIFAYGDARFYGSTGSIVLNKPIVGLAPTPLGNGYWLVAADGGLFNFGDAPFLGSAGARNEPVAGMAASPTGHGYWLAGSVGKIFPFGDAVSFGARA
jgi:hypothetical protein